QGLENSPGPSNLPPVIPARQGTSSKETPVQQSVPSSSRSQFGASPTPAAPPSAAADLTHPAAAPTQTPAAITPVGQWQPAQQPDSPRVPLDQSVMPTIPADQSALPPAQTPAGT